MRVLRRGSRGERVTQLRVMLRTAGYNVKKTGSFNRELDDAVRDYQEDMGLVVDGLVGNETYTDLQKLLNITISGLTVYQFQELAQCSMAIAEVWTMPMNMAMKKYNITTKKRITAFISQLSHESQGFSANRENMNYGYRFLKEKTKYFTAHNAYKYGRVKGKHRANQKMIANLMYGGRKDLGNRGIRTNDGWDFRGATPIHLTGRANYASYAKDSGNDIVSNPRLTEDIDIAADICGWFWSKKNLNRWADMGMYKKITKIINGGYNGWKNRKRLYNLANINIKPMSIEWV